MSMNVQPRHAVCQLITHTYPSPSLCPQTRHGEPPPAGVQAGAAHRDVQPERGGDGEVDECSSGPHSGPAVLPRPEPPPLQHLPLRLHHRLPGHQPAGGHGPGAPHPPVQHHDRRHQGHADGHQAEPLHRRLRLPHPHLQGAAVPTLQVDGLQPQLPGKRQRGGAQRDANTEEQERRGGRRGRGGRRRRGFTGQWTSVRHGHAGEEGAERTQLPGTIGATHLQGDHDRETCFKNVFQFDILMINICNSTQLLLSQTKMEKLFKKKNNITINCE